MRRQQRTRRHVERLGRSLNHHDILLRHLVVVKEREEEKEKWQCLEKARAAARGRWPATTAERMYGFVKKRARQKSTISYVRSGPNTFFQRLAASSVRRRYTCTNK